MKMSTFFVRALILIPAAALSARADVTPFLTDARLSTVGRITTDGTNFYATGTRATAPFGLVYSIPVSGSGMNQIFAYGNGSGVAPNGITVVGSNLYWIDAQSGPVTDTQIFTAAKNGTGGVTAIYTGSSVGEPIVDGGGIATDGTSLYTADWVQGRVHRLNTNGSGLTQLGGQRYGGFFDREHANSLAVANGVIYIADSGRSGFADTPPRIQSIPTSGGSFTTLFTGTLPGFSPNGIAVLDDMIYLTNATQVLRMPIAGGTPTVFASDSRFKGLGSPVFLNGDLYVTDSGSATIWKIGAVPEPGTFVLSALGGAGLLLASRRRTARRKG